MAKLLSQKVFIERSRKIHENFYDYSLSKYITQKNKLIIICPIHGEFAQIPASHMAGNGCQKCSIDSKAKINYKWTIDLFLKQAKEIYGNIFEYDLSEYSGSKGDIRFKCKIHGWKEVTFTHHIMGKFGCPPCNGRIIDTQTFIEQATKIHGTKYDYSEANYQGYKIPISIICSIHGMFKQLSQTHIGTKHSKKIGNCPQCSTTNKISKIETEWLDIKNIDIKYRQLKIVNLIVDGFDPKTNTIYEFYGDFWHGNPEIYDPKNINPRNGMTYEELFNNTMKREEKIKNLGYNLITIWENEFKKQKSHLPVYL